MYCEKCGAQLLEGQECPNCKNAVRVLTPEEKDSFDGITIDQRVSEDGYRKASSSGTGSSNRRVYISMSSQHGGLLTKLVIGAILAGLIMFIALPVAMLALGGVMLWFIFRILR